MNPFRSFAARSLFVATSALVAMACSGAPESQGSGPTVPSLGAPAHIEIIDAPRISTLAAGETLVVDLSQPDVAYEFDSAAGAIDFSRVSLRFADGADIPMDEWRAQTETDGTEVTAANAGHFFLRPTASEARVLYPEKTVQGVDPPTCVVQTFCLWVCDTANGPCTYECVSACI